MKLNRIFLTVCLLLTTINIIKLAANNIYEDRDSVSSEVTSMFILGDINNDGITDTAFVITPPLKISIDSADPSMSRPYDFADENPTNKVRFSCKLPEINYPKSVWGEIENLGKLSGGEVSDLLFVPGWFQGCWSSLNVFQYHNKKWINVGSAIYNICDDISYKDRVSFKNGKYYILGEKFNTQTGEIKDYKVRIKFKK